MNKYLPRHLSATIQRALSTFGVVVVTGARQTGKTTLLREELGGEFALTSLEDPDVRAAAQSDPRGFLGHHPPPRILDEIQHAPELLSYLKTEVDEARRPGRWVLTGSQSFPLMESVSQSLAGRAAVLHLHGLSAAELTGRPLASTARELLVGGYPEPRLHPEVDLRLWMAGYLSTYLERDVRQLAQVGDLQVFEQFLRLCAARSSQLLNHAELARDVGVSPTTARRWIAVLEASGVLLRVRPYTTSPTKRLVKSPKLYPLDTGLAAFLTGHREADQLWQGPLRGALFEAAVLAEIVKAFTNVGDIPPLSFWRASDGLEVDFVLELAGRLHGFECKANATPMPRMADSLVKWRSLLGEAVGSTWLVCDVAERRPVAPEVMAIPWREVGAVCQGLIG